MRYFTKGKIHWVNLLIIIASFTGVLFIVQPEFLFGQDETSKDTSSIYYLIVLAGAFSSSLSMIFLHDLRGKVKELVALNHAYLFQCFSNSVIYMILSTHEAEEEAIMEFTWPEIAILLINFVIMSLFALLNQFFRAKAIFLCSPALILPFNYLTVILGVAIDILFFGSSYSALKIFGMILASFGLFSKFILLYIQNNK